MRFHRFLSFLTLCGLLSHLSLTAQADFTPAQPLIEALTAKAEAAAGSDALSQRANMELALARHIDEVQNKGGDVDKELSSGNTALMFAVALGEREAARYLLLFGADPNKKNAEGKCALDLARDDAMRTLLKEEAPLTTWEEANKVFEDFLPLIKDDFNNHIPRVEAWRKAIDNKNAENSLKALGSLIYCAEKVPPRLISFLMRQVYPSKPDSAANWWLQLLQNNGRPFKDEEKRERLIALISSYSYCMKPSELSLTNLETAARDGYYDFFRTMVERGADPMKGVKYSVRGRAHTDLAVNHAVKGGHKEIVELIMERHTFSQADLDALLAEAVNSHNHRSAEMESFIREKGGRYSRKCLLDALNFRDEAWMLQVYESLGISNKAELTQLLIDLVAVPMVDGNAPSSSRSALIERLVNDGADVHVLERMPRGKKEHPLYSHFKGCFNKDLRAPIDTYETLVKLGINEKTVLTLPMTPKGDRLIMATTAPLLHFLAGRIVSLPIKDKKLPKGILKRSKEYKTLDDIMQGLPATNRNQLNYETKMALSVGALPLVDKLLSQGANLEEACNNNTGYTEMELFMLKENGHCFVHYKMRAYEGLNKLAKGLEDTQMKHDVQKLSYRTQYHALFPLLADFRQERSRKTLEYLVNKGVDMKKVLNIPIDPRRSRTTLLMYAAMDSLMGFPLIDAPVSPEALEWLLAHGADPMARDCDGNTALDFATDEKKKALLRAAMEKAQKR